MKKLIPLSFLSLTLLAACAPSEFSACGKFPNGVEDSSFSVCLYKNECFVKNMNGEAQIYDLDGTQVSRGEGSYIYNPCTPTTEEFFNEIVNK